MTDRLHKALQQLAPEQVERVEDFAESLAQQAPRVSANLSVSWAGKAAHAYPEHASGVEAAHSVGAMLNDATDRATNA